jgi:tripeptidyl-peptidase-2
MSSMICTAVNGDGAAGPHARRAAAALAAFLIVAAAAAATSAGEVWNYLPNDDIGAVDFKSAHPTYDGRGVIVAILDTGIDAFAPGLERTLTGQTKLIGARDFSGQGDWEVALAERDTDGGAGPIFKTEDGLQLRGAQRLAVPPPGDDAAAESIYIGVIEEGQFHNSRVHDLNDDGDTSDRFGFLCYLADRDVVERTLGVGAGYELLAAINPTARDAVAAERRSTKVWLVVVDTDGDGDLTGAPILRDYHVDHDSFRLGNPNAPDSRTMMAWQVTVRDNENRRGSPQPPTVEFHFDDGSHGTHCAGIAAGYRVSGQDGLDGVAPGAWLLSCKLGDNRLAGGATRTESMKKAYEYAAEFGETYGVPVVVNMSFGIASVEEGDDAMGNWLDDFLAERPGFYVCTSAGNEGPGLSTVGLPATSISLIASGGYLSVGTGHDLYNADLQRNTLFAFSSRGGETAKPDVVAPASALSTVPGHVDGSARFNGTSMASPQTAGAIACLLSGAQQEGLEPHWGMVKRALIAGAQPVEGFALTDQGGGLVALEPTWDLLRKLARSKSARQLLWYRIETECALQADGTSDAAYWRTPGGAPLAPERVTFTVHPIFHPDLTADEKDTFFRSFDVESEASWLKVVGGNRYIRGDMGMQIVVQYDGERLTEPGAYAARVIGSLDGGDLSGLAGREFYLWNTVVVGESLGPDVGYVKSWTEKDQPASWVRRRYVDVPPGASALRVRLEASPDVGSKRGTRVVTEVCNPDGHVRGRWTGYASPDGEQVKDTTILRPELQPGTWEINVITAITAMDPSSYRLTVACDGYDAPEAITALPRGGNGEDAAATFAVTRSFGGAFRGDASAAIEGLRGESEITITDSDEWTYGFTLDSETPRALFVLTMDKATANLFTDCAVNILDADGRALHAGAFDGTVAEVGARLPDGRSEVSYTLQVVGGFAIAAAMEEWGFTLEEKYYLARPIAGEVTRTGGGDLRLYSGLPAELKVSFADSWPAGADDLRAFGAVRFRDANAPDKRPGDERGPVVLEVPIRLE